jgi:hypothetical protein
VSDQAQFDAAKSRFQKTVGRQLLAVAQRLTDRHRGRLGVPYPPASTKGEYPHRRPGDLLLAVVYNPKTESEAVRQGAVTVSYNLDIAPHAEFMAGMQRLGIADTKDDIRGELEAVLRREEGR